MRVLLTGGSGFVGAHTVRALAQAGHEVRLLARDEGRLAANLSAVGATPDEVLTGDVTDAAVVRTAVAGCDAVVHAAALVALSRRDADRVLQVNVEGTRTVVDAALDAGADPVVYVSSVAALYSPGVALLHPGLPPAVHARNAYTRSKALAEQLVRQRQAAGAPVTVVYPGGAMGPAAGSAFGEAAEGVRTTLRAGVVPLREGVWPILDVRDLAAIHLAALRPGRGPRRYMCGGHRVTMEMVAALLREVTGRRVPLVPLPGALYRALGRAVDVLTRVVPVDTVFTAEAMDVLTRGTPTDDRLVHDELGVGYRDPRETLRAAVVALHAAGRLTDGQAGLAAAG